MTIRSIMRPARRICAGFAILHWLLVPRLVAQSAEERPSDDDNRYRWQVKIDTSLASHPVVPTTLEDMLTWAPPPSKRHADAPRDGRELHVYGVNGWVRRIKDNEDGDLHIALTATPTSPPDSCIVAEIPATRYGATYIRARQDFAYLLRFAKVKKSGRLETPVLIHLVGAAFYDDKHRSREPGPGKKAERPFKVEGHGECNASESALWELHPVYRVEQP